MTKGDADRREFSDSEAFNQSYDGTRLATILADPANGAFKGTVLKQAQFDALARIKTLDIGLNGSAAVATVDYTYDAANARLTRVRGMIGATTPVDLNVGFDGLGRLATQSGALGAETVSRSFTYDGLSRLKTATGPWEKATGAPGNVVWTYSYDALGNLRGLASNRTPANLADNRTWSYADPVRPHYLSSFAQQGQLTQTMPANATGEPSLVDRGGGNQEPFTWNAQGKLYNYKSSTYSWDAFDQNTLVVTGVGASQTSIVRVGDDFEYDLGAGRATKYFSVDGVQIAVLATLYSPPAASLPPALYPVVRTLEPLGPPAVVVLFFFGLASLGAVATRKRPPAWVAAPGVGLLGVVLVALPYSAFAATLPAGGPGTFGRPAEPFLAYLTDHLGSVRAVVNASGTIVETRDYDPFGGDIAHTGTFSVQHRFTGQPADDQAGGLYNYGARFYNPKWGRFVSPDELVQGFDSQGLNPFAYVLNAPTNYLDPTGNDLDGWGVCPSCWSQYVQDYLRQVNSPKTAGETTSGSYSGDNETTSNPGIVLAAFNPAEDVRPDAPDPDLNTTAPALDVASPGLPFDALPQAAAVGGQTGLPHFNVDLIAHEAAGGHTIRLHVAKQLSFLYNRMRNNPELPAASSFESLRHAAVLINRTLNENAAKVDEMMAQPGPAWAVMRTTFKEVTGYSVSGNRHRFQSVHSVFVRIQKPAGTKEGFVIVSGYPVGP